MSAHCRHLVNKGDGSLGLFRMLIKSFTKLQKSEAGRRELDHALGHYAGDSDHDVCKRRHCHDSESCQWCHTRSSGAVRHVSSVRESSKTDMDADLKSPFLT